MNNTVPVIGFHNVIALSCTLPLMRGRLDRISLMGSRRLVFLMEADPRDRSGRLRERSSAELGILLCGLVGGCYQMLTTFSPTDIGTENAIPRYHRATDVV